jgi:hypothetical protein
MKNNIIDKNIIPFKTSIFNDDKTHNINDIITELPTIPKIYFPDKDDKIGATIINDYNIIRLNIKKLETIKNFILSILKSSSSELENIRISKQKYNLYKNNLLILFESNLNETFKDQKSFHEFINTYNKNNYNIFKSSKNNIPLFLSILQTEYLGNNENKNFFLTLLNKYIKIRNILIKYMIKNNGILGFNMIFEINDNISLDKLKNSEKEKIKKENNNKINYSKYILSGNNLIDNSTNVISNSLDKKAIKPTLQPKINKSNLLYIETNNADYYINLHNTRLTNIYNNIITPINNFLDNSASCNLYNVVTNLLELDSNLFVLTFYYIDNNRFNNFINVHIRIKDYICQKINIFALYYDQYIDWYNRVILNCDSPSYTGLGNDEFEDFKKFFDNLIKEIDGIDRN